MTYDFKNLLADGIFYTVTNKIVALALYNQRIEAINKTNQHSFWFAVELNNLFWTNLFAHFVKIFFFEMEYQVFLIFTIVKGCGKQVGLF